MIIKVEEYKRFNLIAFTSTTILVIPIKFIVGLLLTYREETNSVKSNWSFVNKFGGNIPFGDMNEMLMEILEAVNT